MSEPIIDYLRRKLKESGASSWPGIAATISAGLPDGEKVSEHFLRKLAYGDRENPGIQLLQPLLNHFGYPETKPAAQEAADIMSR